MKRILKFVLYILISLFILSCNSNKNYEIIDKYNHNISQSMKDFFSADGNSTLSNSFQSNFCNLTKVKFIDDEDLVEYTFFIYDIIIAPRTLKPISIESIKVLPTGVAFEYLTHDFNNGRSNLSDWQRFAENLDFPLWTEIQDFTAYRLLVTYNDLGSDTMTYFGINEEDLEPGMLEIKLRIKYSGGVEELILHFKNEPKILTSIDDPQITSYPYLKALVTEGKSVFRLEPYNKLIPNE